jgi:pre-mRNA branch site protein p14
MDAKQACDKLNGFNFQNRYLVGTHAFASDSCTEIHSRVQIANLLVPVLYHQPEKAAKSKADLEDRKAALEATKRQHGID